MKSGPTTGSGSHGVNGVGVGGPRVLLAGGVCPAGDASGRPGRRARPPSRLLWPRWRGSHVGRPVHAGEAFGVKKCRNGSERQARGPWECSSPTDCCSVWKKRSVWFCCFNHESAWLPSLNQQVY